MKCSTDNLVHQNTYAQIESHLIIYASEFGNDIMHISMKHYRRNLIKIVTCVNANTTALKTIVQSSQYKNIEFNDTNTIKRTLRAD